MLFSYMGDVNELSCSDLRPGHRLAVEGTGRAEAFGGGGQLEPAQTVRYGDLELPAPAW